VELEHSFEQVELTAILSFDCNCYFSTFWLLLKKKNIIKASDLMCYYFKPSIEIKHIDIARHRYCAQIRAYEGFIAQRPLIGGHRDFNLSMY